MPAWRDSITALKGAWIVKCGGCGVRGLGICWNIRMLRLGKRIDAVRADRSRYSSCWNSSATRRIRMRCGRPRIMRSICWISMSIAGALRGACAGDGRGAARRRCGGLAAESRRGERAGNCMPDGAGRGIGGCAAPHRAGGASPLDARSGSIGRLPTGADDRGGGVHAVFAAWRGRHRRVTCRSAQFARNDGMEIRAAIAEARAEGRKNRGVCHRHSGRGQDIVRAERGVRRTRRSAAYS